ncbi:OmpA family protein [Hydrocarboniphaga sp.]|uniref:OmpA family protein n=1 Tax=Hydrocarboniphaga sp. TaxID=2033016 RepID=UPI003D14B5BB
MNIAAVQARTPIVDGDADGVDDAVDQCLYTPPQATVDARGCSAQTDQDGDGVADTVDDCPYTTAGAEVDARGCALDDDFDGVANGLDACLGTELGAVVDTRGCASGQIAQAITPKPRSLPPATVLPAKPTPSVIPAAPSGPAPASAPPPAVATSDSASASAPATAAAIQSRAPVRIVIPAPLPAAPPAAAATPSTSVKPSATAAPNPAALLSLSFGSQNNNIGPAAMAKIDKALPALRAALASQRQGVLLVEGFADTESDGDAADTVARSRANMLRRVLEQKGIDGKRLRSVGHQAVDAGTEFRRADVMLEAE